ncbi:MAG: acetyl-CoA carboxylase biotin carboxyl carrier protein [Proteobacteria bacterium]|nr:acetyl-CoA carboxylase biotin carboxyl carrier protein [Pseudomonadota bacterium]
MAKFEPDDALIRRLAALLEETGLSEIEYEAEGRRIRVARGAGTASGPASAPSSVPAPQAEPAASAPEGEEALPPGAVTSPMVGTVYAAAEPGAPPLVKVGDSVKEGQTLLIIEAMKVMNPLASPRAGTVTRILVVDGQPVEFGELLLVIE